MKEIFNNLKGKIWPYYPLILLLVLGLLPLIWFRGDYIINYGDQALPFFPLYSLKTNISYLWSHQYSVGLSCSRVIAGFFYTGFFALFEALGFSLIVTEKFFYCLLFFFSGVSMYYLSCVVFGNKNKLPLIASALFYLFNFFPLFAFWRQFTGVSFLYVFTPFFLGFYIRGLQAQKWKYLFLMVILSVIFTPMALNPAYLIVGWLFVLLYGLFYVLKNRKQKPILWFVTKFTLFLIVIEFLINLWWILPLSNNFRDEISAAVAVGGSLGVFNYWSSQTSILNLFRLLGPWPFTGTFPTGDPFYIWSSVYFTPLFILFGFIPLFIALISFIGDRINQFKEKSFFLFLFILGLFITKGSHSPFGNVNLTIFNTIPFMDIFRSLYDKVGIIIVVGYAILFGCGIQTLEQFLRKKNLFLAKIIILAVFIISFGVYMWPYWTGDIIYGGGEKTPSARIKVPDYYYEAGEWMQNQSEEFKILSLPHQEGAAYSWEHGYVGSDDPTVHFLQRPILAPTTKSGDKIIASYLESIFSIFQETKSSNIIAKILGSTNIRYVLVHNDINYYVNTPNPQINADYIKSILTKQPGISLEKSFGKLDFYKISDDYFLPHFYIPKNIIYLNNNLNAIDSVANFREYDVRSLFLTNNNINKEINKVEKIPKITFARINPTKYIIKVEEASKPYILVFSESFHIGWKAYININGTFKNKEIVSSYFNGEIKEGTYKNIFFDKNTFETWGKKPIAENRHFIANRYANSWYIVPEDADGRENYEIIIEFWPQRLFYIGLTISAFTFLGCLCYLIYGLCMKKKRVKVKQVR